MSILPAVGKLITSRRNFLIRASAVTAAGATVAVPIVTIEGLRDRCEFHAQALHQACQAYYVGLDVRLHGNKHTPEEARDPFGLSATWMVTASLPDQHKSKFSRELDGLLERFGH